MVLICSILIFQNVGLFFNSLFLTEEVILKDLINCSEQMKKLRHGIKEIAPIPAKNSRPC